MERPPEDPRPQDPAEAAEGDRDADAVRREIEEDPSLHPPEELDDVRGG